MGLLFLTFTRILNLPLRFGDIKNRDRIVPLTVKFKAQKLEIRAVEAMSSARQSKRSPHSNFPFRVSVPSQPALVQEGPLIVYQYVPGEVAEAHTNPYGHFQQLVDGSNPYETLITDEVYFLSNPVIHSPIPDNEYRILQGLLSLRELDVANFVAMYVSGNDVFKDVAGGIYFRTKNKATNLVSSMYLSLGWNNILEPSYLSLQPKKVNLPPLIRPSPRQSAQGGRAKKPAPARVATRRRAGAKVKAT
jgi:hypothetical protein